MLVNFEAFGNVQYSIIPEIMSSKNAHVVEQVVVELPQPLRANYGLGR